MKVLDGEEFRRIGCFPTARAGTAREIFVLKAPRLELRFIARTKHTMLREGPLRRNIMKVSFVLVFLLFFASRSSEHRIDITFGNKEFYLFMLWTTIAGQLVVYPYFLEKIKGHRLLTGVSTLQKT